MTSLEVTLAIVASVFLVMGSAEGAMTTTTPFVLAASGEIVECGVVNAGTTIRTVRIQILRAFDGHILNDTGTVPVPIAAGGAFGIEVVNPTDEVYCRFVASASTMHGSLNVRSNATFVDRLVLPAR